MVQIPGGLEGYDSTREIQGLNRGADRLNLREHRDQLAAGGPASNDIAGLSGEEIRSELVALSIFFIEQTFSSVWAFLDDAPAPLLAASPSGDGFTPLLELTPGPDPLTQIARHIEVFLSAMGRFCEHLMEARIFQASLAPEDPIGPLYQRYRDVLARLDPPTRPTDHGIMNGLAGMQVVLALCEVVREVYLRQEGRALGWEQHERILLSQDFERLVLAIGATRSRASNCLLAELGGDAFWTWRHSLRQPGAARLRFLPERFFLDLAGAPPALQVKPETIDAVRRRMEQIETPGRSKQLMCPAFFAETGAMSGKDAVVIQDFVRWILSIVVHYRAAIWP